MQTHKKQKSSGMFDRYTSCTNSSVVFTLLKDNFVFLSAERITNIRCKIITQKETFHETPNGRIKTRILYFEQTKKTEIKWKNTCMIDYMCDHGFRITTYDYDKLNRSPLVGHVVTGISFLRKHAKYDDIFTIPNALPK